MFRKPVDFLKRYGNKLSTYAQPLRHKLWIIIFSLTFYPNAHAHIHSHLTVRNIKKYNCVDKWRKPLYYLGLKLAISS